mmetsp:Transcript_1285/g.4464  ORF Transcript_1285/g.4464 Transcript_1285/m.4464 type:complete len:210 (+) Transcript_1285:1206-1835(+)
MKSNGMAEASTTALSSCSDSDAGAPPSELLASCSSCLFLAEVGVSRALVLAESFVYVSFDLLFGARSSSRGRTTALGGKISLRCLLLSKFSNTQTRFTVLVKSHRVLRMTATMVKVATTVTHTGGNMTSARLPACSGTAMPSAFANSVHDAKCSSTLVQFSPAGAGSGVSILLLLPETVSVVSWVGGRVGKVSLAPVWGTTKVWSVSLS